MPVASIGPSAVGGTCALDSPRWLCWPDGSIGFVHVAGPCPDVSLVPALVIFVLVPSFFKVVIAVML